MSEHHGPWPTGAPCWSDLGVPDVAAARSFYADVFGWRLDDGPPESGGYVMATLDGLPVAGIGPLMTEGQPTTWTTYLATDDADTTTTAVTGAGGTVLTAPFDVMDVGRMAIVVDPPGAVVGLWQARGHDGYGRVNEAGAPCWNEVHTRDAEAAKAFYATVFGYTYDVFGDPSEPYASAKLHADDADPVAGVFAPPGGLPDGVAGYWLTWFGAADTDATVLAVTEHGGTVLMGPFDSPFGRSAVVLGAQGEMFGIVAV
jgi:predicted enzyme related to lactoylglutathione lyase